MMFILQIKNKLVLVLTLFLFSCQAFVPMEPVVNVNDRFIANYGNLVGRAKKRHYDSIKKSGYDGTVSFENTAYGKQLQSEIDFVEINKQNNPYKEAERASSENLRYRTGNFGSYMASQEDIFDSIKVPKNDFKYYYIGGKEYNDINNIELQEAYDYIDAINREKLRQIEIIRLREEILQQQQKKKDTFGDRTKRGIQNLTNKIKSLLN